MGFLDKLMGLGGAKSDSNKQKITEIFNSKVENGEEYATLGCFHLVTTKKLMKEVRTFFNYIVGYKDASDPEIVIIPVSYDLSDIGDPILCKKSECTKAEYLVKSGEFIITHPELPEGKVPFCIIVSTMWDGYIIKVSYVHEYAPFTEFFEKKFAK